MKTGPKIIRDQTVIETTAEPPIAEQRSSTQGEPTSKSKELVTGPAQQTAAADAIQIRAALEQAIGALERTRGSIEKHLKSEARVPPTSLASAIFHTSYAFLDAMPALGAGATEEDQRRLFDSLGKFVGPLEHLVDQVWRDDAPKKARELRDALSDVYRVLLTPTETLYWPEPEQTKVGPAGKFLPTNAAVELAKRVYERFQVITEQLAAEGAPLSKQAEIGLFGAMLSGEHIGSVMSVDAGVLDFLPEHIAKSLTRDHHGIHSEAERPQVNSTMKMLEDVEIVRGMTGVTDESKIARLQNLYAHITTNNLGDAIIPLVLARRIPELVREGGLTVEMKQGTKVKLSFEHLRRMSHFEDFGFFGSAKMGDGKRHSPPGEVVLRDLIHLVLANFQSFDELLQQYGLHASDRFDMLPDSAQARLVEEAIAKVEENFDHYDARLDRSTKFKSEVTRLKGDVKAAHEEMREYLVKRGVSAEDIETLDRHIFYFFDSAKGGRFATWDAPSLIHNNAIQWQSMRFPTKEGEPEKWGFVLAVPSERDPHFLDTSMVNAFSPHFPKAIVRGDTLMFVFNPADGDIAPAKMASILAQQLRAHHRAAPPPHDLAPAPTIGENVISHDAYIYNDQGYYVWTPDRLEKAEETARAAFTAALEQDWCTKAVLVVGTAGSGKSTYLAQNMSNDTVYYDSTLATPERRRALIEAANERGIPVEIVWTDTSLAECLARNAERSEDRRVPEHILVSNHVCLQRDPPSLHEGVQKVTVVRRE